MLNNIEAVRIIETAINQAYNVYVATNDIEVLSAVNSLFNVAVLSGLSFSEGVDDNGITTITLKVSDDREYPDESYFLSLNKIILMGENHIPPIITVEKKQDIFIPIKRKIHAPIKVENHTPIIKSDISAESNILLDSDKAYNVTEIPMNVKTLKKPKSYMISCNSYDGIDKSRLSTIPQPIRLLYESCGFKSFLKGSTVIHSETAMIGVVKSFAISHLNTLIFIIKRSDGKDTSWSMDGLLINNPVGQKPISIMEYIKLYNPTTNKQCDTRSSAILCRSFKDVPRKRLSTVDKDMLELYKKLGYRDFLRGKTLYNGNESAVVNAFYINRYNKFEFRIRRPNAPKSNEWVMTRCKIKVSTDDELISIAEYIDRVYHIKSSNIQLSIFS